jgi:hypothetical protein
MIHSLRLFAEALIALPLSCIGVYAVMRLGSAAWFQSKLEYEVKKGTLVNGV